MNRAGSPKHAHFNYSFLNTRRIIKHFERHEVARSNTRARQGVSSTGNQRENTNTNLDVVSFLLLKTEYTTEVLCNRAYSGSLHYSLPKLQADVTSWNSVTTLKAEKLKTKCRGTCMFSTKKPSQVKMCTSCKKLQVQNESLLILCTNSQTYIGLLF